MPTIPRHPHCMCRLIPVFTWQVTAKRTPNDKLANKFIGKLDIKEKLALFGNKGLEEYHRTRDWQSVLRGWDGFKNPASKDVTFLLAEEGYLQQKKRNRKVQITDTAISKVRIKSQKLKALSSDE